MLGLGAVLLLIGTGTCLVLLHARPARRWSVRTRLEIPGEQLISPIEHDVDARRGVPRVLHASGLHGARSGLRPRSGDVEHPARSASPTRVCAASSSGRSASRSCSGRGTSFIGHEFFFLNNAPATYGSTGVAFLAFFLFQFAFADTCSTITSGAMVGRTAFGGDLIYSFFVSGFIYPIFGHWIWGPDGWLATLDTPFRDFAGSTVVHTVGGFIALTGAIGARTAHRSQVQARRGRHAAGSRHDDRRHRWRHPVVRLVRLQPRQHAVGHGLRRHRPSRRRTRRSRRVRPDSSIDVPTPTPAPDKWDTGITVNGFLAGLVAITCSVLLGDTRSVRSASGRSPASS